MLFIVFLSYSYILQSEGEKEQDKSGENALTTSTNLELGFPEDDEETNNPEGIILKNICSVAAINVNFHPAGSESYYSLPAV